MNVNYLTIPLLSLNIIFSVFVAQKVFYDNSVDVVMENEETQGECEIEFTPVTTMSAKVEEAQVKKEQQKDKPAKAAGITETATFEQADAAYKAKKAEALRARNPEERKRLKEEAEALFYKAKALHPANK